MIRRMEGPIDHNQLELDLEKKLRTPEDITRVAEELRKLKERSEEEKSDKNESVPRWRGGH